MKPQEKLANLVDYLKYDRVTDQAGVAKLFGIRANYLSELINGTKPISERFVNSLRRKGLQKEGAERNELLSIMVQDLEPARADRSTKDEDSGLVKPMPLTSIRVQFLEERYRDLAVAYVDLVRSKKELNTAAVLEKLRELQSVLKEITVDSE